MTSVQVSRAAPGDRSPLVTRELISVFASMFAGLTNFYLLLSVVPMWAAATGAGENGAGLATATLMLSTVIVEFFMPGLVATFGYRKLVVIALLSLAIPSLALCASTGMATIALISLVRGVGLGIVFVVGSAMVALLVPHHRRGEGLGLYGAIVGLPAIVALPLGVWLVGRVGFNAVFVLAALAALAGLVATPGLPQRETEPQPRGSVLRGLRSSALILPAAVFSTSAMATGAAITFIPLVLSNAPGGFVALALFVQTGTTTGARWLSGRYGDRHGSVQLLFPAIVASAAGMFALTFSSTPACLLGGMALLGAGFGAAQNASLSLMFERAPRSGYDATSAVWNIAYDAGLGLGALAFGMVASRTGYPIAFALSGACVLAALAPLRPLRTMRANLTDDRPDTSPPDPEGSNS